MTKFMSNGKLMKATLFAMTSFGASASATDSIFVSTQVNRSRLPRCMSIAVCAKPFFLLYGIFVVLAGMIK
jgi:hypothetical protein